MKLKVLQDFPGLGDEDDLEVDIDPTNSLLDPEPIKKGPGKGHSDNLFTLSGKVINPEGKEIGKTKFFNFIKMPLENYDHLILTDKEVHRIRHHIMHMKYGMSSFVPIICFGPHVCKFVKRCPIYLSLPDEDKLTRTAAYPIALPCLLEAQFASAQLSAYAQEYDISPDSPSEMAMISKLVELDTYEYRASLILSGGAGLDSTGEGTDLLLNQTIAMSPEGDEIKQQVLHPLLELKFKLQGQRDSILTALVGTRREKYKQKQALRGIEDSTNTGADKLSSLNDKIEALKNKISGKDKE